MDPSMHNYVEIRVACSNASGDLHLGQEQRFNQKIPPPLLQTGIPQTLYVDRSDVHCKSRTLGCGVYV